ncbi:MAG: AAA family ATPase [bacterium]|nr:AAA family ATPase [bacterium]
MVTIAVLNQKGGVGKTTTAINVAAYAAKAGKKVLVVDLDPQGNATSGLGLDKSKVERSLYDCMIGDVPVGDCIYETSQSEVYLLPSSADLAALEIELAGKASRERQLKNTLSGLTFDIILIDCPPSLGVLTINALTASDDVLVPVQTEFYALEGLSQLVDLIQRVKQGFNPDLRLLGVVLTMYDGRTSLAEQVVAEVEKHFGDRVFKTRIPRNVRLAEAPSFGLSILQHDKWSKGARSYKALTKEILNRVK